MLWRRSVALNALQDLPRLTCRFKLHALHGFVTAVWFWCKVLSHLRNDGAGSGWWGQPFCYQDT